MNVLFPIAFFGLLAGILAYTLTTLYSTSRKVKVLLHILAMIVSVVLAVLGLYVLVDGTYSGTIGMWALGTIALVAGFWLKNPLRDFQR